MTCYPSVDAIIFNEQASAVPDYDAGPPIVRGLKSGQVAFYLKQDGQWYTRAYNDSEQVWETGGGGSVGWADVTGKPSTFPPSSHTHAWDDLPAPSWTNASKLNGWSDYSTSYYGTLRYAKVGYQVFVRGMVTGGSPRDSYIFRLPSGYRPPCWMILPIDSGAGSMSLYVRDDGYVHTKETDSTWRSICFNFLAI